MRDAFRQRKDSYWVFLARGTQEAADRYQLSKRIAARVVAKAKTQAWVEFGEAIEKDLRMGSRQFWSWQGKITTNTVYDGDGALLTSPRKVVGRWAEYLLNPTSTSSNGTLVWTSNLWCRGHRGS